MTPALTAVGGAARVFGATARALALDLTSALATGAETIRDAVSGRTPALPTLPVRVLILSDEDGSPLCRPEDLLPALARADRAFTEHAGIRVRTVAIDTATEPAPTEALDTRSNRRLLLDDILGRTRFFRQRLASRPPLSVVGDPVTVVVVRSITGRTTGCSLGMSADWVICRASLFDAANPRTYDETVLAHELGHALNLPHRRDIANLMNPTSSPPAKIRGTELRWWQAAVMRGNRHIVPAGGRQ